MCELDDGPVQKLKVLRDGARVPRVCEGRLAEPSRLPDDQLVACQSSDMAAPAEPGEFR